MNKQTFIQAGKNILLLWSKPIWAMLIALCVYAFYAWPNLFGTSVFNYFAYLADGFLHKQLYLRLQPPGTHDLVHFNGQLYLYWPALPAILLMPFVAIFGVNTSDIFLTVVIAAFNVYLFTILLREAKKGQLHNLSSLKQAIFVIFFSFGTVHFTLAPYGKVWQMSQEISLAFMLISYITVISLRGWKAFFFTGLALAGAMLTRSHLIFIGIWPAYYLIHTHWETRNKQLIKSLALASFPIFSAVFIILIYNELRFGNPLEMGLQYHQMSEFFVEDYKNYGAFNPYYIPTNLYYHFIYYPFPPRTQEWMMGGSLFLLSPVFFGFFTGFQKKQRLSQIFMAITIAVVYIPIMFLMGTGWVTFGPRYTLDFIVPLLLITANGVEKWRTRTLLFLTIISCLHYIAGTYLLHG